MEGARARILRAKGWSLRRIALELDVAVSSVSVWVRDVEQILEADGPTDRSFVDAIQVRTVPVVHSCQALRPCGRCRLRLPLANYSRHPTGYQWWCKDCFRSYFARRGETHYRQVRAALGRRQLAAKEYIADVKRRACCADCGEPDHLVLEFDHVRPKQRDIAVLVAAGASLRRIEAEIGACEVVCVNCHRRRTYLRLGDRCWRVNPGALDSSPGRSPTSRRNLVYLRDLLACSSCIDCGSTDLMALEFDHQKDKAGHVTVMAREACAFDRLKREIAKCQIRCGNCHRRRTMSASGDGHTSCS